MQQVIDFNTMLNLLYDMYMYFHCKFIHFTLFVLISVMIFVFTPSLKPTLRFMFDHLSSFTNII